MNDRDALRYAGRRAALIVALQQGDAVVAARAAGRLRVPAAPMLSAEFAQARAARRTLGRAIVGARLPKVEPSPVRREAAISAPRSSRRPVAVALALAAVLLALLVGGPGPGADSTTASDSAPSAAEAQRTQLLLLSRGRTISLPQDVVAVQETPAPTAAPTTTPGPANTTAPAGAGSGTRTSAPGGGSGAGGVGLGILPTPAPTPTPRPLPTRPIPMPGFTRISVTVLDGRTFLPIPDVCVLLNDRVCTPTKTLTDSRGKWADDIPVSTATVFWDVYFVKAGYGTVTRRVTLQSQRIIQLQVFLFRTN
jgi:hypothetical protein